MFVTHQHYDNCMSGANSYVNIFKTFADAKHNMIDSIYQCLAHCEKSTMDKIADFLNESVMKEINIDGFKIEQFVHGYHIEDECEEDYYDYRILDVDGGNYESSF